MTLSALHAWALRFRLLILAVAAGVLATGIVQLREAPVDVLPEFTPPYAEIQTEALGLSAEEVEQLITVPLEADLLNGVEGVRVIRSESVPGLSSIVMVFEPGTNVYRARQLVEERLTQAHALPNVSKPPALLQPLSSSSRVLMIGLTGTELTPIEQSVVARWTIRPRLMGVPGVANVAVWGMRDQQLQVQVDPATLRDRNVTLSQVVSTAGNAQVVSPLSFLEASTPGTGGFLETPQQRLQVRHLLEKMAEPAELAKVPLEGTEGTMRLGDVATLTVDHQPLIGDASIAGEPALLLVVEKFPGASTTEVTRGVEQALETLRPGLTGMTTDTSLFRPANYLGDALGTLGVALLAGFALLLAALLALRLSWRSVLVAALVIPLSVLAAVVLLRLLGQPLNALVLGGLAAAVTIVVDDAVAAGDRVSRGLRARNGGAEQPVGTVVQQASSGLRRPLVYASLLAGLVALPVVAVQGRPGAFLAPMVLAYGLAVGAALVVAVTATPALQSLVYAGRRPAAPDRDGRTARLSDRYRAGLARFSARRRAVVLSTLALALVGLAVLPFLSASLVPSFQDRNLLVRLDAPPGTSAPRMTEIANGVSRDLQELPGVAAVAATVGRAVSGDRVVNVNSGDVWVALTSDADHDRTLAAIRDAVADTGDVRTEVSSYTATKMRDVGSLLRGENAVRGDSLSLLTGLDQPLAVRLFGQDPEILRREADRIRQTMSRVDGIVSPTVQLPPVQPTVEIEVDLAKAQAVGLTPGDVRRAEATLLQGIQVGSVFEQQRVFDVVVQGNPQTRQSLDSIRSMLIDRPGGGHVALGEVADVRLAEAPAVISRDAVSRRIDITAGLDGRSAEAVAQDLRIALAAVDLPLEYHAEVVLGSTADEMGLGWVAGVAGACLVAAFLLLQAAFGSWRLAALVAAVLPLSLVGGLVAAGLVGLDLTLGALLGLVAVLVLAARTTTVLVSDVQAADAADGPERVGRVTDAAGSRLRPVLATGAALAALLLPAALLGNRAGLELLHPFAVVVLGGLVSTLLVTLLLLPALYLVVLPRAEQPPAEQPVDAPPSDVPHPRTYAGPVDASGNGWHDRRRASASVGHPDGPPPGMPERRVAPHSDQP